MNFHFAYKLLLSATLGVGALLPSASALAQDYPSRNITMVMPYAAGGPGDIITRLFASSMQKQLGQTIVVDNPAGAGGSMSQSGTTRQGTNAPAGSSGAGGGGVPGAHRAVPDARLARREGRAVDDPLP